MVRLWYDLLEFAFVVKLVRLSYDFEMLAECNEKYPTQTEELRDCRDGAEEKWREMFSDSPCLFLCPAKN